MNLKPEEISSVIKEEIKRYSSHMSVAEVGTVIQVADVSHVSTVLRRRCRVSFWSFRMVCGAWYSTWRRIT